MAAKEIATTMMSNHGMLVPLSGLFQKQADKEPGQRGNNDVAGKPGQQQEAPSCS
jgi:hypothetical protein